MESIKPRFFLSLLIAVMWQMSSNEAQTDLKMNYKRSNSTQDLRANNKTIKTSPNLTDRRDLLFKLSKIGREAQSDNTGPNRNPQNLVFLEEINDYDKYVNQQAKSHPPPKKSILRGVSQIKSIYNSLKNEKAILNDLNINTVRYVPSTKGNILFLFNLFIKLSHFESFLLVDSNNKVYFLFNLSLLTNTEQILKSELYINKKYIRQRLIFDLHYFLYSTIKTNGLNSSQTKSKSENNENGASMTIDLRNFRADRFNKQNSWQSFNILEPIKSYLNVRNTRQYGIDKSNKNPSTYYTLDQQADKAAGRNGDELVLIMETSSKPKRSGRFKKSLPDSLNPYLLIYSQENEYQMKQFFESKISPIVPDLANNNNNNNKSMNVTTPKLSRDEMEKLKSFEDQVDKLNELYDDSEELKQSNNYELAKIGLSSQNSTVVDKNKSKMLADYLVERSKLHDSKSYYDYLSRTDRIIYKNEKQKRSVVDGSNALLDESKFEPQTANSVENKCGKQSILIDFNDMSFSDWILEPKSYQSNYCSGSCKFPLSQVCVIF